MNIASLHNQVEYYLSHESHGEIIIEEPVGFKQDLLEIKKSDKNYSTTTKYATNLEFIGIGANFINEVYDTYGFEARIKLTKKSIHPTKIDIVKNYQVYLDGYTRKIKDNKVKINTLESELNAIIKNYGSEKLEIENEEAINGNNIGALAYNKAWIDGRDLFLISKWSKYGDERDMITTPDFKNVLIGQDFMHRAIAVPLEQYVNSDEQTYSVTDFDVPANVGDYGYKDGDPAACFYSIADEDIDFDLDIDVNLDLFNNGLEIRSMTAELHLVRYMDDTANNNSQHVFVDREILYVGTGDKINRNITYRNLSERHLDQGESFALVVMIKSLQNLGHDDYQVEMTVNKANLVWSMNSHVDGSHSRVILPFELFDRLLKLMTGSTQSVLVSDHLGRTDIGYSVDGDGAFLSVANGFYARQFVNENLTISFNDAILSYGVADMLSYVIERKGLQEFVRIEPLSYFFGSSVVQLTNPIKDIEIEVANKYSYSGIEIGYEKGGADYEEADGLVEYNGKHTYASPLSRAPSKYKKLSKIRGDMTGFEFARRKPESLFPTTDTNYDKDVFFLDLKRGANNVFAQKKWEDDFNSIAGVYSPSTATNLRISPKELLKRHGWFIKNCLTKNLSDDIYFGSGIGSTEIELDGLKGSDNLPIADIDRHKFINLEVKFTMEVDYETQKAIEENINDTFEVFDENKKSYQFFLFAFKKNKFTGLLK